MHIRVLHRFVGYMASLLEGCPLLALALGSSIPGIGLECYGFKYVVKL